jgi:lauroyl/myristoyl acyltransferase
MDGAVRRDLKALEKSMNKTANETAAVDTLTEEINQNTTLINKFIEEMIVNDPSMYSGEW